MIKFTDLKIGDVFAFHGIHLVKIADNPNYTDAPHKQLPNSINLANEHYIVTLANSPCELIKSRDHKEVKL